MNSSNWSGLRYLRANNLGHHDWELYKGPNNSAFEYYWCLDCGLNCAISRRVGLFGYYNLVFSLKEFNSDKMFDRNMITVGRYAVMDYRLAELKNPKCVDIRGIMMNEALE